MRVRFSQGPPEESGQRGDAGSIPAGSTKVFKIEAGKNQNPTLDTLKKISKALEVSVDELIK